MCTVLEEMCTGEVCTGEGCTGGGESVLGMR